MDSRLTVILVSTAANWRTLESRRARGNLSLPTKHPGGILVNISSSRVTHWTTWLHSRVFSAEGQKWREPPPRTTAAFVKLRTLSIVAVLALVSSRYHHHSPQPHHHHRYRPPPPTIAIHRHPRPFCQSTSIRLCPTSSRRFGKRPELATILSIWTSLPHTDFNPLRSCILTVCVRYNDCTRYVYHFYTCFLYE